MASRINLAALSAGDAFAADRRSRNLMVWNDLMSEDGSDVDRLTGEFFVHDVDSEVYVHHEPGKVITNRLMHVVGVIAGKLHDGWVTVTHVLETRKR